MTILGLGGCPPGWGDQSDEEAVAATRRALELGISYADTAPSYGVGRSEMRFGQALSNIPRDSYVIPTKVGRLLKVNGTEDMEFKASLSGTCRTSLRYLISAAMASFDPLSRAE